MTIGALAALLILGAVVVAFRTVVEDQPQAARRHPAEVTDRPDAVVTCSGEPAPGRAHRRGAGDHGMRTTPLSDRGVRETISGWC
jgi:hypothetical protein